MTHKRLVATAVLCGLGLAPAVQAKAKHGQHQLREVLWRDPGDVSRRDLVYGPGGRENFPLAPFRFVEEDLGGTNPKIKVKDAKGVEWAVKWGPEAYASSFSSHFVWACGYTVEPEYFIANGRVAGAHHLKRAAAWVNAGGSFRDARFQIRKKSPKFVKDANWAWINNPFLGTPEFNGLRILMMLLSNWDAKDARDFAEDGAGHGMADSNLGIFKTSGKHPVYEYFVSDWGATLGKWSPLPPLRSKWDSRGFADQSAGFVKGVRNGEVMWGYSGTHGGDLTKGIRVSDVQWLMRYLGQLTGPQIRRGLAASGAKPDEVDTFAKALDERIRELRGVADGSRQ